MSINLDSPEVTATEPRRRKPDREQAKRCGSDALATACYSAVRNVCGPWGKYAQRDSDHERDALMQSLALWSLEHRERLDALSREQIAATLRAVLRQDLLRDGRHWRDSLDGVPIGRNGRPRTRPLREQVSESVAEQAARHREHERSRRPAPHTGMDALTERHRSPDGSVDWLEVAGSVAAEADAGEQLPAVAYCAHSPELAARMADRIAAELGTVRVSDRDRESLRIALTVAAGETCATVAAAERVGIATAKRRSTEGHKLLATLRNMGMDLAAIRRECVAAMMAEDRATVPDAWEPRTVAEVDAELGLATARGAVDGAIREQRAVTARYLAGSGRPAPTLARVSTASTANGRTVAVWTAERPHGQARDVLAYIDRLSRALTVAESPASTYATDGAVRLATARDRPRTARPNREPVKPEPKAPHVAWLWPDALYGGQAAYSRNHPARGWPVQWSFGESEPAPRPAEPVHVSEQAAAWIADRRRGDALKLARLVAREPDRGRRVCRLVKLALANLA